MDMEKTSNYLTAIRRTKAATNQFLTPLILPTTHAAVKLQPHPRSGTRCNCTENRYHGNDFVPSAPAPWRRLQPFRR